MVAATFLPLSSPTLYDFPLPHLLFPPPQTIEDDFTPCCFVSFCHFVLYHNDQIVFPIHTFHCLVSFFICCQCYMGTIVSCFLFSCTMLLTLNMSVLFLHLSKCVISPSYASSYSDILSVFYHARLFIVVFLFSFINLPMHACNSLTLETSQTVRSKFTCARQMKRAPATKTATRMKNQT